MPNENSQIAFDLEERTAKFGEGVVKFANYLPKNTVTMPLINQLVKSGTSVGANYCEADDAESRKDFIHKLGIAKKEARETKYWLKMVEIAAPEHKVEAGVLWQEAKELHLILNAIVHSTRNNTKNLSN